MKRIQMRSLQDIGKGCSSRYKLIFTIITVFISFFAIMIFGQNQAFAATPENGVTYHIFPEQNINYNIDVFGQSSANCLQMQIWSNNTTVAQDFGIIYADNYGGYNWYYIINLGSGKALDVRDGICNLGAVVQQYTLNYTNAQKWCFISMGIGSGGYNFYKISPRLNPSYCIDVCDQYMASGTKLIIWSFWGGPNQKFAFNPTNGYAFGDKGNFYFKNGIMQTGMVDINGYSYFFAPISSNNWANPTYLNIWTRQINNSTLMTEVFKSSIYIQSGLLARDCTVKYGTIYSHLWAGPTVVTFRVYYADNNGKLTYLYDEPMLVSFG